ncbi:MAG TPA: TonB-dependent receptor [Novosphingobium sp.]|nr:TonB-dependent receptor [Novosphingobium sp.]
MTETLAPKRTPSRHLASLLALGAGLITPLIATPALAQGAAAEGAPGDIVVTARSRAESIEKVPLSVTAFTAAAMEQKSIQSLSDVARFTPGLSFENFSGGFATPVIRGQTQTSVTALESNVSTFYDGVYIPRSWAIDTGVATLDRVEVVKGPQSARYGRNAFAGAINYVPRKASLTAGLSGEVTGTVGSDKRYDGGIFLNLPLASNFAIAGGYTISTYDGSWHNASPYANANVSPGTTGNIGGYTNKAYAVSAVYQPIDAWRLEFSWSAFDINREANASTVLTEASGQLNCGTLRSGHASLLCGSLSGNPGAVSADPRSYGAVTSTQILRAFTSYKLSDRLTASYLFGRITGNVDIGNLTVTDNSNCGTTCTFQNAPVGSIHYDSHEARLTYDSGHLRLAAGGFLSKGADNYKFNLVYAPALTATSTIYSLADTPGTTTITLTNTTTTTVVRSGFLEAQWTSPDGATRLGAEGRVSSSKITSRNNTSGLTLSRTFTNVTPRFSAEHDVGAHAMLYASAAKGAKAGGFNPTAVLPEDRSFGEETNWTFELGSKNQFLDRKLTINADVFYTKWSNIQINSPDSAATNPNAVNITLNLGNANVYGFEFDTAYKPDKHWTFDANFSYTHARYAAGTRDSRFSRTVAPCDNVVCPSSGSIAGNQVERAPGAKGAVGAQWQTDMPWKRGRFFLRGDLSWQDKFYDTPMNLATIPARTLVNARTGVTWRNIDTSLWVTNLFDKVYVSNAYVVLTSSGNSYQLFYGQRRAFGLTAKATF